MVRHLAYNISLALVLMATLAGCGGADAPMQNEGMQLIGMSDWTYAAAGVSPRQQADDPHTEAAEIPTTLGSFGGATPNICWTTPTDHNVAGVGVVKDYTTTDAPVWQNGLNEYYVYAPWQASDVTMTMTDRTLGMMTWSNVPGLSQTDHLVAKRKCSYDRPGSWATVGHIPFRLQHLQTRLNIYYALGEQIGEYRKLEVVRVDVCNKSMYNKYNVSVTPVGYAWENRYDDFTPATLVYESVEGAKGAPLRVWKEGDILHNGDSLILTRELQRWGMAYLIPQDNDKIQIITTYNVYDDVRDNPHDPHHTLMTRRHSRDTFNLTIPAEHYQAGIATDLNLTIEPKYLFVLDDDD